MRKAWVWRWGLGERCCAGEVSMCWQSVDDSHQGTQVALVLVSCQHHQHRSTDFSSVQTHSPHLECHSWTIEGNCLIKV